MPNIQYKNALMEPLGLATKWEDQQSAKKSMQAFASLAMEHSNTSLWWSYIYLHELYVEKFAPRKEDRLPGFPGMDDAVKLKAPPVYNWYNQHKKLKLAAWPEQSQVDIGLGHRLNYLDSKYNDLFIRDKIEPMPVWLLCSWRNSPPQWAAILEKINTNLQPTKNSYLASSLDRLIVDSHTLWQWSLCSGVNLRTIPALEAVQQLDHVRSLSISDMFRTTLETRFLNAFPEFKKEAEIAFSLGGPLSPSQIEDYTIPYGILEEASEALHRN